MSERKGLFSLEGAVFFLAVFSASVATIAVEENARARKAKAQLERFKEEACIMGRARNRVNVDGVEVFTWGH